MSSSRARSRLAIAAMTFLATMASGCISPGPQRIDCTCTQNIVEPPIASGTVVARHTDQCPVAGWVVCRESVDGPAAGFELKGAHAVEVSPDAEGAKANAFRDDVQTQSGLTIDVIDLVDPAPLGFELTYKIIVSNKGALSERNVCVVATLPRGMVPVRIGTGGRTITEHSVRFDPVAEIRPGEQREYQVVVRTLEAGQLTFRAELTSDKRPQPLGAEATTEVLP